MATIETEMTSKEEAGEDAKVDSLCQRFPDASKEDVKKALAEAGGHGGKAAMILDAQTYSSGQPLNPVRRSR